MVVLDVVLNVVSDFLFLAIVLVLGWLLYVVTRRNKLLGFFGIADSRRLVIYLSRIRVQPRGAIGVRDDRRPFHGSAYALHEMEAARAYRDLFNYLVPSLSDRPGLLSKLFISDVQVQVLPSPL